MFGADRLPSGKVLLGDGSFVQLDGSFGGGGTVFGTCAGIGLLGCPCDPQAAAGCAELEDDPGACVYGGMVAAQAVGGADAGHGAVQGEADRVQDAGLPRAGVAAQQEQARAGQGIEIDVFGAGERAECLDSQMVEIHQLASRAAAWVRTLSSPSCSRSCSSWVAGRPLTWWRNPRAISWSVWPWTRDR